MNADTEGALALTAIALGVTIGAVQLGFPVWVVVFGVVMTIAWAGVTVLAYRRRR